MTNNWKRRAIASALTIAVVAAGAMPSAAAGPGLEGSAQLTASEAPEIPAAGSGRVIGQCWKDGQRMFPDRDLGDSSDPDFPARAQAFYEECLKAGGSAKFLPAEFTSARNPEETGAAGGGAGQPSDTGTATPRISLGDVRVTEPKRGQVRAYFPVWLSEPARAHDGSAPQDVRVQFRTYAGSAKPGRDYRSATGTVAFAPGETTKRIPVPVLSDSRNERTERFFVKLSSPTNADLEDRVGRGTILSSCSPSSLVQDPVTDQWYSDWVRDLEILVAGDPKFPLAKEVKQYDSTALERLRKKANQEKDQDYRDNGGKPGTRSAALWKIASAMESELQSRGYTRMDGGVLIRPACLGGGQVLPR